MMCSCTVETHLTRYSAVCSQDLDTYKVSFDYIFEEQMGMANWALSLGKLSVQDVLRNATIFHSMNVAQPMQSVLF